MAVENTLQGEAVRMTQMSISLAEQPERNKNKHLKISIRSSAITFIYNNRLVGNVSLHNLSINEKL